MFNNPSSYFAFVVLVLLGGNVESFAPTPQIGRYVRLTATSSNHLLRSNVQRQNGVDALLDEVLQVAIDASKKAGDIILQNSKGADVSECKANSRDLLTLIDPLCEKVRKIRGVSI